MSRRISTKRQDKGKRARNQMPLILIFGENANDSTALKALLAGVAPALSSDYRIEIRKDPPSLTKTAKPPKVQAWLENVRKFASMDSNLHAVLIHQDADGPDPKGARAAALQQDLNQHLAPIRAHAVVPVQMTEAWWLLFPDQTRSLKPGAWRAAKFPDPATVENITDPKSELTRLTNKVAKGHAYAEADSKDIAAKIAEHIRAGGTAPATCTSWERFVHTAQNL